MLQTVLDKNSKWHRDRRARDAVVCTTKWINYYEMRAKNTSPKSKLQWQADIEREKQKHQSYRAPDSRAYVSQQLSTIGFIDSIENPSNTDRVGGSKFFMGGARLIRKMKF